MTLLLQATMPHWCFGSDNSGDIRQAGNVQAMWQEAVQMCRPTASRPAAKLVLVTADGAIDSSANPNEQEEATAALHMCEMVTALGLLSLGGAFVIKVMLPPLSVYVVFFLLRCTPLHGCKQQGAWRRRCQSQ